MVNSLAGNSSTMLGPVLSLLPVGVRDCGRIFVFCLTGAVGADPFHGFAFCGGALIPWWIAWLQSGDRVVSDLETVLLA